LEKLKIPKEIANNRRKKFLNILFLLFSLIISLNYKYGEMKIKLRDGRIIDVPVNKVNIISIIFEDQPMAGGGIAWAFETGDCEGG
jgi:hypothetical protein